MLDGGFPAMLLKLMAFYIGIDAGGTKTTAVLADETTVLAQAAAGTIKPSQIGLPLATDNFQTLLQAVASKADISLKAVAKVCLGLAGSRVPENMAWAKWMLSDQVGSPYVICEDVDIALEAAFAGGPGALVISGTGSHVLARRLDGRIAHAGGYGPLVSDEGSGSWIGIEAGRRALYDYDGQTISPLMAGIMREWGCDTVEMVIGEANSRQLQSYSILVPLVCALAEKGNAMALGILVDAGKELARLAKTALTRLAAPDLPVACTGSILENIPAVRKAMIAALPGITVLDGVVDPVEGALWLARNG